MRDVPWVLFNARHLSGGILISVVSCVGVFLFFFISFQFFAQNVAKYSFFTLHIVSNSQNNLRGVFRDVCEFFTGLQELLV